ncbi:hypothetical protein FKM82_021415 [Ascaphus truei]
MFVVQTQYGCELREDGSTGAHYVFGYNGRDYMMYDKETRAWKPLAKEAAAVTRTWNNDRMFAERLKNYLEQGCVGELETFVGYGKEALDRKVRPAVKVWSKESPGHTQLHCLAYGFYPRDADVTWTLESQEIQPMEAKQILPNPDGTYQIRVTVEVTPEDRQNYTCHVEHDSLPEMLHVLWVLTHGDIEMNEWQIEPRLISLRIVKPQAVFDPSLVSYSDYTVCLSEACYSESQGHM